MVDGGVRDSGFSMTKFLDSSFGSALLSALVGAAIAAGSAYAIFHLTENDASNNVIGGGRKVAAIYLTRATASEQGLVDAIHDGRVLQPYISLGDLDPPAQDQLALLNVSKPKIPFQTLPLLDALYGQLVITYGDFRVAKGGAQLRRVDDRRICRTIGFAEEVRDHLSKIGPEFQVGLKPLIPFRCQAGVRKVENEYKDIIPSSDFAARSAKR
jgi:hypothetical protein